MDKSPDLLAAEEAFIMAYEAFMQNPTPPMANILKRLAGSIRYKKSIQKQVQHG
jgi:hypothetical protein